LFYAAVNFGPAGTTKGILVHHSKGNDGGKLQVRLGKGTEGQLIAEFSPARTSGWDKFLTAYVELTEDVEGLQDITLLASVDGSLMNLKWFELTDFSDKSSTHPRIAASAYSDQKGLSFERRGTNGALTIGYWDNNDFVSYTNVNFGEAGSSGSTSSIRIRYAKDNHNGKLEFRIGGPTGTVIATFSPTRTGGWGNWVETLIPITASDVYGINDVTLVGKDVHGVLNLEWFELVH
jgi:hypothetical protein